MALKGCGSMTALLLVVFALLIVGSNEGIGYYFSHCGYDNPLDCLFDDEEEPEPEGAATAAGTYTYKDYPVTVTMNIPLEGGAVTGAVSETCSGKVKGTFSGQDGGAISGTLSGVCDPFVVNVPSSAEFTGTVNKTAKTVSISFDARGGGFTHAGSMSLSYP